MGKYDPKEIEPKWQQYWLENKTFRAENGGVKPKFYCLDMFPYPSGAGLHVGHPEGYTATDIICRYKRMQGFNVLHPMGWDAFGLPAEQHAIQTGTHPRDTTVKNIDTFRRQIRSLGFSYDWDREVDTTDPGYFKWTQWIFKQLFESWYDPETDKARPMAELPVPREIQSDAAAVSRYRDTRRLAYMDEVPVWWCPALGTVLANEEVVDGKSERGGHPCERKPMRQWMLRITAYSERLLRDLDTLDWPDSLKSMQRNWIGRSTGARVDFALQHRQETLEVFTTRPDTLFGATYMVVAPEHPLLRADLPAERRAAVEEYRKWAASRSELERGIEKDKTGVDTGLFAINPVNGKPIPIWTADYVMMGYGTGAIMAVPAHDERDYAFARKFGLEILEVISGGDIEMEAHTGGGKLIQSGLLDGLDVEAAKEKIIAWLAKRGLGCAEVQYKLRDWLFSRQRYWGEPFPIVHTETGPVSVPDQELPVTLPKMDDYKPTGTFEPPLSKVEDWVRYENAAAGIKGRRETNTMPQWAGSSWYYLRYTDAGNNEAPWSREAESSWMPVDLYIGGAEHAVLHLLYSRFWHKVLFDLGHVSTPEPFQKLVNQGLILGEDGEKMSKSRGNVVNPDDVIASHGADAMRLYEMFMGPLERMKPWQMAGIEGQWRFLNKAWRLLVGEEDESVRLGNPPSLKVKRVLHQTIKKVGEDIENLRFNTAIAQMMIYLNEQDREGSMDRESAEAFVKMLHPFCPHLGEELWSRLGHSESISYASWPDFDPELVIEDTVTVVFQTNGKVRAKAELAKGLSSEQLEATARSHENMAKHLEGMDVVKVVAVPDRLVNFVIKPAKS